MGVVRYAKPVRRCPPWQRRTVICTQCVDTPPQGGFRGKARSGLTLLLSHCKTPSQLLHETIHGRLRPDHPQRSRIFLPISNFFSIDRTKVLGYNVIKVLERIPYIPARLPGHFRPVTSMPTYTAVGLVQVGMFCFRYWLNCFFPIAEHHPGVSFSTTVRC